MLVKHLQIGRKTGSTGKCGNERSSKNVHKKPCCDFKATYVQIDAKFHVFKGIKTEKGKKLRTFTARKNLKKDTKFSENKASLAAFSDQPASEAQRLGSTSTVIMRVPFVSSKGFYGRLLRVRLASFLC